MPAKASRAAFGEALLDLGARDERIVTLDADLSKSTMTVKFGKTHPDRAFNVGIAESNMIGIGAGLALTGKIPFVCSFACFVVGRFETIRISVAYTNANVKIVGTHAGIAIGEDGYSQMGLEDIACLRSLPNIPIIQPADELETKQVVQIADVRAVAGYVDNPVQAPIVQLAGVRSKLSVPMLKEEDLIGVIEIDRQEVRAFTDKQISLVKNFAAQAVIAIENARLLTELRESLQQQTATADVLKVISSSPGELEPVFNAMLERATRICGANFSSLLMREGDAFRFVALHNAPPALAERRGREPVIRPGSSFQFACWP